MLALSVDIEGQEGLTWPRWRQFVAGVEALGFAGLFRADQFLRPFPPEAASLELVVSLAHLADRTQRVRFGPLVAPVSCRDPAMLARRAAALDDLSVGRFVLGLGAGWIEREHRVFGYALGDVPTRMARFEEALAVVSRSLRNDDPSTHEGRFFLLREASLLPRPAPGRATAAHRRERPQAHPAPGGPVRRYLERYPADPGRLPRAVGAPRQTADCHGPGTGRSPAHPDAARPLRAG